MAYITLRSGERVFVQSARHDDTLDRLVSTFSMGYNNQSGEAIRIITDLGPLAAEILPNLDYILLTVQDQVYRQYLEAMIEKIKPVEKKGTKEEKIDVEVKKDTPLEADAQVFKKCNFCEKETLVQKDACRDRLCPPGRFYCHFCLRHSYNNRDNRHLLMFTMRSVFGYYFWQFYFSPPRPYMWLSEIKDYISLHEEVGLRNPLFNYDPESYTWFVDFRRIGDSKKKAPLVEVKKSIVEMLSVFNMHIHIKGLTMSSFYEKFKDAIDDFYNKRHRPDGRRMLAPTFKGCGNPEWGQLNHGNQFSAPVCSGNKLSIEETKNFTPSLLKDHLWNKTSAL